MRMMPLVGMVLKNLRKPNRLTNQLDSLALVHVRMTTCEVSVCEAVVSIQTQVNLFGRLEQCKVQVIVERKL